MFKTESILDRVCALWAEAIGIEDVQPDDDFFDLGGNSMTAIRLLPEIQKRFSVEPTMAIIFDNSTPRELAESIELLSTNAQSV